MKDYWYIVYAVDHPNHRGLYFDNAIEGSPAEWAVKTTKKHRATEGRYMIVYAEKLTAAQYAAIKDEVG